MIQPQEFLILIITVLLAVGLFGVWRSFHRMRALADTPIARIRSAPQGYVELRGQAAMMEGDPILAPLSGLPCAWYRFRVEEKSDGGRWWVVNKGVSDFLFLLKDGTGQCVIDPDGAEFIKTRRDVWYGNASGARSTALWGMGASYRYTEQRIMPGEELHAIGLFNTVGGHSELPDTRHEVALLLESWKKDPRRMALFDRRKNGRIDPDEWEAARRAAYRQVQRQQLTRFTEPEVHMLSNPADSKQPFLISTVCESRLIRRYQRHAVLYLFCVLGAGGYLAWTLQ